MTERIEQSRRHGHHDPRWTGRMHAVTSTPAPAVVPEEPTGTPPTLTLVGGTDVPPTQPDAVASQEV